MERAARRGLPGVESDESLVARFRAGDEGAFETLVRRYEASLRKLAFGYLRDRMLAEDVAQESLLLAYQRIGTLGHAEAFRSWLSGPPSVIDEIEISNLSITDDGREARKTCDFVTASRIPGAARSTVTRGSHLWILRRQDDGE